MQLAALLKLVLWLAFTSAPAQAGDWWDSIGGTAGSAANQVRGAGEAAASSVTTGSLQASFVRGAQNATAIAGHLPTEAASWIQSAEFSAGDILERAKKAAHKTSSQAEELEAHAAVITVRSPWWLAGDHSGYFAISSDAELPRKELAAWVPDEEYGCYQYYADGSAVTAGFVAVVRQGQCSLLSKAQVAQEAGAKGVIVISASEVVEILSGQGSPEASGIFVVGVAHDFGEQLSQASMAAKDAGEQPVMLGVFLYKHALFHLSDGVLVFMGTALVALGAWASTADLDTCDKDAKNAALAATAVAATEEDMLEVDCWTALGLVVFCSLFLLFLFFFMNYLIYFVIASFCLNGATGFMMLGSMALGHVYPALRNHAETLPILGAFSHADMMLMLPASLIVSIWLALRHSPYGWPFQDFLGACFLCSAQRTFRLPNLQAATLLLSAMFCFDIFWVFLSPVFFHQSVMVSVATHFAQAGPDRAASAGESMPMLLRVPAFGDAFATDRLLGFGDIALPGLLISYLRRHDLQTRRRLVCGYFAPALAGYFLGLIAAFVALDTTRIGQPALLYLVPGTLGPTFLLAAVRGEAGLLWEGALVKT